MILDLACRVPSAADLATDVGGRDHPGIQSQLRMRTSLGYFDDRLGAHVERPGTGKIHGIRMAREDMLAPADRPAALTPIDRQLFRVGVRVSLP